MCILLIFLKYTSEIIYKNRESQKMFEAIQDIL